MVFFCDSLMIILFYRGLAHLFLMTLKFQALSAGTVLTNPLF